MDSKKWYLSKALWAGVVGLLFGIYDLVGGFLTSGCLTDPAGICIHLPLVPSWVFAALSALGIYGRATATTTLTK